MTSLQAVKPGASPVVFPTESGHYEEPTFEVFPGPKAEVKFTDPDQVFDADCTIGTSVDIREGGTLVYPGIVNRRRRKRGVADEVSYTLALGHRGYEALRNTPCDPYIYDEDGDPVTDRDAMKVNPWERFIFYNPLSNTLDADGNPPFVHGISIETDYRSLIGTRFVYQHEFVDNSLFLPSMLVSPTQQVQVYQDQAFGDDRIALARTRGTGGYRQNTTPLESIALMNGDPDAGAMGELSSATMYFIGKKEGTSDLIVDFTRNAGITPRTWIAASVVHTPDYLGSGLDLWTCTATFASTHAQKNQFGFRIRVGGTSTTATTRVFYAAVVAITEEDTGVTEGDVDTYTDPKGLTGAHLCVVDDYSGMNRLQALSRLRKTALGSLDANADIWIDADLLAHFKLRRGADLATPVFDLDDRNLVVLDHEEFAEDLAYQVVAIGAGRGAAERVIVDLTDFASGGLYDATRAPGGVNHKGHGVRTLRDTTAQDVLDLRRRARAWMSRRLDVRQFFDIQVIPFEARTYETGDRITVTDSMLGITATLLRVASVQVAWSPQGHKVTVRLGEKTETPLEASSGQQSQMGRDAAKALLQQASAGIGGPGVICDATHLQRATIGIPEGVEVDRLLLAMTTIPFQFNTRGAASIPAQTTDAPAHSHTATESGGTTTTNEETVAGAGVAFLNDGGSGTLASGASNSTAIEDTTVSGENAFNNLMGFFVRYQFISDTEDSNWQIEPQIRMSDGTYFTLGVEHLSNMDDGEEQSGVHFVPSAFLKQVGGTAVTQARLIVKNVGSGSQSFSGNITIDNVGRHAHAIAAHTHTIAEGGAHSHEVPSHSHAPLVGIWSFDGDTGNGNGTPLMGTGEFAVDPTLNANGVPTAFDTDKHPVAFGDTTKPVTFVVDVTGYLRQSADGRIAPGEHNVFFRGRTGTNNSKGLLAVQVTPILRARQS